MAKRVVWTSTARLQRKEILSYWVRRTGSTKYSKKLSEVIRRRIKFIKEHNYLGKPTDYRLNRITAMGNFSIFYIIQETQIVITSVWDNRQDPDDLNKIL
ncbi:MAG TPA: type II toxin-antitoxin system RelE/ParE family toxin [Anditalea sp.]|nr:type II toxin-antitoxin system RelE/ParE family toxin [Anditalea sp.]